MSTTIDSPRTAALPVTIAPAVDTVRANRAAALASYLNACSNVGAVPDPGLLEEHGRLADYAEIDPADDHLVLEAQVEPGTLGWIRGEREPATGTLVVNGMLSVSLTFRGDGLPTVVVENLHESELLVAVEDGNGHRLYHGLVDRG